MNSISNYTGLSVEKLVKEIAVAIPCGEYRKDSGVPLGRLMNDLGNLLRKGTDGAEEALIAFLNDERYPVHSLAYAFLHQHKNKLMETSQKTLSAFENDPAMSSVVTNAKAMILAKKIEKLSPGSVVRTTSPNESMRKEWTKEGWESRQWGVSVEVIKLHGGHGLSYEVRHADGTIGHYDPSELEVVD